MITLSNTQFFKISTAQLGKDQISDFAEIMPDIKLPARATKGSCGYDFFSPMDFTLKPGQTIKIPTLIKCEIADGWFLMIVPRSGLGFKYKCKLDNTVGIIDSDYFNNSSNEGHIWVKITNTGDKEMPVKFGEAFCQGIFLPYGCTSNDAFDEHETRTGGFGSTTK